MDHHKETAYPSRVKGFKVRTLNIVMILMSCTLYIALLVVTFHASQNYDAMVAATNLYIDCQENAALVSNGSDYLTEQMHLFVINLDPEYAKNYFAEVNVTRRRDQALEHLEDRAGPRAERFLQTALELSNQLMEQETYAMRLAAEGGGLQLSTLPEEIQSAGLSEVHRNLSPEQKLDAAREMVFGPEYQAKKQLISSNVNYFLSDVLQSTQTDQETSAENLHHAMWLERVCFSLLFAQNVLIFLMIIFLIIKPLRVYVNCIRKGKLIEITGAYEFKYLALTYNDIYEVNAANEHLLRYQAEHDPLTGLMNRGAFDHIKEVLKFKTQPIAMLLIDVDKFKQINDGYGHEVGDKVLKKVARLLGDSFRSTDFPARVGGDEFSVILTDVDKKQQSQIEQKIETINDALFHPTDGLPQVSLSVGGVFSPKGYTDEMYHNADAALYQVKENGRRSCRFYSPDMPPPGIKN